MVIKPTYMILYGGYNGYRITIVGVCLFPSCRSWFIVGYTAWHIKSMAISGTKIGGTYHIYEAYIRPKFSGNIPTKYGLIWYNTSILGS
jgi:hypothetical protein